MLNVETRARIFERSCRTGLLAAIVLVTACAHPEPPPMAFILPAEPYLVPAGATLNPPDSETLKQVVCANPDSYPPRAYDITQLSAPELMALFNSPSNSRDLLINLKLLSDRDLLVQANFFKDEVLLRFFGASKITWENDARTFHSYTRSNHLEARYGPSRTARISELSGALADVTVEISNSPVCKGWRSKPISPMKWWPPTTVDSGHVKIDLSRANGPDVGLVKEIFGPDPAESEPSVYPDAYGTLSFPAKVAYVDTEKQRNSSPFFQHKVEFIPQVQDGVRPWASGLDRRRVFADQVRILYIDATQMERDM